MRGDLKSHDVTASGTVRSGPCELVAYNMIGITVNGSITLRDGGASGAIKAIIYATPTASADLALPGGIRFEIDCYAAVVSAAAGLYFG